MADPLNTSPVEIDRPGATGESDPESRPRPDSELLEGTSGLAQESLEEQRAPGEESVGHANIGRDDGHDLSCVHHGHRDREHAGYDSNAGEGPSSGNPSEKALGKRRVLDLSKYTQEELEEDPLLVVHTQLKEDFSGSEVTPYTLMISEQRMDDETGESFWHATFIVSKHPDERDLQSDDSKFNPLRLLQRMVNVRVPFLKSVIVITLSRPLTSNLYSGSFRIEFGSRAIELQVEALYSDLDEVLAQGVREVIKSMTQISDPDMAEKWKVSMKSIEDKSRSSDTQAYVDFGEGGEQDLSPKPPHVASAPADGVLESPILAQTALQRKLCKLLVLASKAALLVLLFLLWTHTSSIIQKRESAYINEIPWWSVVEWREWAGAATVIGGGVGAYLILA